MIIREKYFHYEEVQDVTEIFITGALVAFVGLQVKRLSLLLAKSLVCSGTLGLACIFFGYRK